MAAGGGFEPTNAGVKGPCLTAWRHPNSTRRIFLKTVTADIRGQKYIKTDFSEITMARVAGFEPTNDRVRVYRLTAWPHPNM